MHNRQMTVDALWALVARDCYSRGKRWDAEAKRLYARHLAPSVAAKQVRDVRPADMERIHAKLRTTPVEANRTLAVAAAMFKYAERWELRDLGTNPCQHVPRFKETSRRRFATAEELAKIGPFLEREAPMHPRAVAFLYLLLYSGARPSEIERVTWQQLDGNVLRIEDGKTGRRDVFLPEQAMKVLYHLKVLAGDPKNHGKVIGQGVPRHLWRRLRKELGCADLWARDLRRTFATVGYSAGVDKHLVGDLLGHADPKTTAIYAKLMEAPAVAASAAIANRMAELLNPQPSYKDVFDD